MFVALGIQHAVRMRHIAICGLPPSTIIFHIFLLTARFSKKIKNKKLLNTKCVFWFSVQLSSETFLVLRRTERDVIKNVYGSSCKSTRYYFQILMELEFPLQIFETPLKCQISFKSFQWEPNCCMRTDGRTDLTKLVVLFEILRTRLKPARCTAPRRCTRCKWYFVFSFVEPIHI